MNKNQQCLEDYYNYIDNLTEVGEILKDKITEFVTLTFKLESILKVHGFSAEISCVPIKICDFKKYIISHIEELEKKGE